jgi:hypothetical protein
LPPACQIATIYKPYINWTEGVFVPPAK